MSIRYSGRVFRITSTLSEVLNGDMRSELIAEGAVEVRGAGATTGIDDGSFSVTVTDRRDNLGPYRLRVTESLVDPCAAERARVRIDERDLKAAQLEGLASYASAGFRNRLAESRDELDKCISSNATALNLVPLVFRSTNMYRTNDAQLDNLEVEVRVLSAEDWELLRSVGSSLSEVVSYEQLRQEMKGSFSSSINVDAISPRSSNVLRVAISTRRLGLSVKGHVDVTITPSRHQDHRRYIELARSDMDLHGIRGSIAGFFTQEEEMADAAIAKASAKFNGNVASQMDALQLVPGPPLTLTLLRLSAQHDGLHVTAALGRLKGGRADPCQEFRNQTVVLENEVRVAIREGVYSEGVNKLRRSVQQSWQAIDECRRRNQ